MRAVLGPVSKVALSLEEEADLTRDQERTLAAVRAAGICVNQDPCVFLPEPRWRLHWSA